MKHRIAIVILLTGIATITAVLVIKNKPKETTETVVEGVVKEAEMLSIAPKTTASVTEETHSEALSAEVTTYTTETQKPKLSEYTQITESVEVTPEQFRRQGVVYADGFKWTWYSERALPGNGLNIPGRHSDGNYVRDGDGYIVLASRDLEKGYIIDTPFGRGKVYDYCPTSGVIDVYTSW